MTFVPWFRPQNSVTAGRCDEIHLEPRESQGSEAASQKQLSA